ncbi:MAG: cytochrome c3 family protein, partial [Candidatus Methanoperedens sp.]|nr:cytochrome c3 family protein [Candidatus Methanoperedens sp.]
MPSEKVTQRNKVFALLLDSGNDSNPITGAQVTANVTYWTYDSVNYTNSTTTIQLIEDINHSGLYAGNFYFYGGMPGGSCQGCHPMHGGDSNTGYFPGNYTATIFAQADTKITMAQTSFEVTPWGCEDCHGSGNPHQTKTLGLDSYCYLCHGLNQIVHRKDDAGNPHQNTAHRTIQCIDCHTNKSLNAQVFTGVSFISGGIENNKSIPQYNYVAKELNSGTHTSLTCTNCHADLNLPTPQGGFKSDNYTIQNTINTYNPDFTSIQQFQDYYVINVDSSEPLNVTLDWEGTSNIGFYMYPPNFNPVNRTSNFSSDKGDYPYYNGSTFTNKPENFTNNTPMPGKWIMAIYGFDLASYWVGTLQSPLNYTINSTYPIQQKDLPTIPECNSCHNSNGIGNAYTTDSIPDWNPGFAHVDINNDGNFDIQCRMCHNAMHEITI